MRKTMQRLIAVTAIATVAVLAVSSVASASVQPNGRARGATTVTLNQDTIGTVVGLGLTPAAVAPGVLGMDGDALLASFPIVGNGKGGVIKHTGGLSLSAGGTTLTLTNYFIDTNQHVLTASAAVNGDEVGRLPLFDLGGAPKQDGCYATASLSLTSDAADALTAIFGAPDLTGAPFGTACVAPRG